MLTLLLLAFRLTGGICNWIIIIAVASSVSAAVATAGQARHPTDVTSSCPHQGSGEGQSSTDHGAWPTRLSSWGSQGQRRAFRHGDLRCTAGHWQSLLFTCIYFVFGIGSITCIVTVFFHMNFFGLFGFSLVHRRTFYRPDVLLVTKPTLPLLTASAITSQSLLRLLLFFRKVWFLCSLHPGFYYGGGEGWLKVLDDMFLRAVYVGCSSPLFLGHCSRD